ncbi:MAG: phage tail tube protein [Marinomonas sp.]
MASKFLDSRANNFFIAADGQNPVFHELPRLEGNFSKTYTTTTDETIVAERGSKPDVITGSSVGGDFSCNLRLSNHYEILRQGAMQSPALQSVTITSPLTYDDGTSLLSGADFQQIKSGMYFKLTHAAGTVVTFALSDGTATELECENIPTGVTAFTELHTTWLETGDTKVPFYVQKRVNGYQMDNTTPQVYYRSFSGVEVFTWTVSMSTGAILTESYNLRGLSLIGNVEVPGQTDADKANYPLTDALGAVKGVHHIDFNGIRHETCFAQNFEFSVDNQGEENTALGTEGACALTYKDPVITGTLNTYAIRYNPFAEEELMDEQTTVQVGVTLYDQTQEKYMAIVGNAKLNSLESDLSGNSTIKNVGLKYSGKVYIYMM